MKAIYIILILLIWLNVFLGNNISHNVIALVTTLVLINTLKKTKKSENN